MIREELFWKTVGILVKAYHEGTLEYTSCAACAVGNICAASNGSKVIFDNEYGAFKWDVGAPEWQRAIVYGAGHGVIRPQFNENRYPETVSQINSTGYTMDELADIEQAFLYGTSNGGNYIGLTKVVDLLMKIHNTYNEQYSEAKSMFVKEVAI